jgi:hypothetical protein
MFKQKLSKTYHELWAIIGRFKWIHSNELRQMVSKNLKEVTKDSSSGSSCRSELPKIAMGGVVLICMARSEGSLLDCWISHHARLPGVEAIILIDHLSTPPIEIDDLPFFEKIDFRLFRFSAEPYLQAHVTNAVAKKLARNSYKESIFLPLDSDEFLSLDSVTQLVNTKLRIGKFAWRNIWPVDLFDNSAAKPDFPPSQVFVAPNTFGGDKHFLRSKDLRRGKIWAQGAHYVQNFFGVAQTGETLGEVLHIPIRSYNQIFTKYSRGAAAHEIKQLSSQDSEGRMIARHWKIDDLFHGDREAFILNAVKDYYPYELKLDNNNRAVFEELLGYK